MDDLFNKLSKMDMNSDVSKIQKRNNFIGWEEYFMAIACLVSKRSKDPSTQVGACIVNSKNRIVGQGYNGMPHGCNDDVFPWNKISDNPLENKYFYVCHAEMNAIFNKNCADISNCRIYTILFPCNQCAKTIIQSGITEVVYMCDKNMKKPEAVAAMRMFDAACVQHRQFIPGCKGYTINLNDGTCENNNSPALSPSLRDVCKKRQNCLPWRDYFFAIAILVAKRSKSPSQQLGACIVNRDNNIIGQGYNGMPYGCSDDIFPWGTENDDPLENKHLYECHAELNAILNAGVKVKNCVMYTINFPCNECAKAIIQSGLSELLYIRGPENVAECEAAERMLNASGVMYSKYTPQHEKIFLDLLEINWNNASQLPPTPTKN